MTHTGSRRETPFEDDLREWMKDPTFETEFRRWRADLARRGGAGRATKLSPEERSAQARRAGLARHGKLPPPNPSLMGTVQRGRLDEAPTPIEMRLQVENDELRAEVDRLRLENAALKAKAAKRPDAEPSGSWTNAIAGPQTATPRGVAGFGRSYPAPKPSKGEEKPKRRFGR